METEVEVKSGIHLKKLLDLAIIKHTFTSRQDSHGFKVRTILMLNLTLTLWAFLQTFKHLSPKSIIRKIRITILCKRNQNGGMMVMVVAQRNGTPLKKCKHIRKIQMNSTNRLGNHGLPVQIKEIKSLNPSTNTLAKMKSTLIMAGRARVSIKNNCMIKNI